VTTVRRRSRLTTGDYIAGVLEGDRSILARAVTLIESTNDAHRDQAREVLNELLPHTGGASRIGITGVPGVGKSTFIESFGLNLTAEGHRLAVLAVDPTSERTGGSILGDKTRMQHLSVNERAFIRPSPSSGMLGGVNQVTRETMLLCEAAGCDVIIIETVGVGQSETAVASMVDFFLVLMLPGAGDDLQGIKRGLMEVADMIVVNKADAGNEKRAQAARTDYTHAIRMLSAQEDQWLPPVLTCSALHNQGLDEVWQQIARHRQLMQDNGAFDARRKHQLLHWFDSTLEHHVLRRFYQHPRIAVRWQTIRQQVSEGVLTPSAASAELVQIFAATEPSGS
jgi:LAO/AO transport system kinase